MAARLLPRGMAAIICMLSLSVAHAASTTLIISNETTPPAPTLKDRLVYLRDLAVYSLAPMAGSTDNTPGAQNSVFQFDSEGELFRPLKKASYSDALKRVLKEQLSFQVGPNTQFQCQFKRYRTPDAQREIGVRLGVHVDFR